MVSASVGNEVDRLLMQRYPDIAFYLNFVDFEPFSLEKNPDQSWNAVRKSKTGEERLHTENIENEMELFFKSHDLDSIDVFYLYGIGLGHHFAHFKKWLSEAPERLLIILEEDLGALAVFLEHHYAEELLSHPQVHLHFASQDLTSLLKELVATFPSERIEIEAIHFYAKKKKHLLRQLKMQLFRLTTVSHALMTEALYSHQLLSNLTRNILQWPGSFFANDLKNHFKGIPAIICGAGPSLGKTYAQLKTIGDRALIIAGGSTISALSNQGINPHIGLALDPNAEEFDRLKSSSSFEMPLIYATRLEPNVFNTCNGEKGYLLSETGGPCENYFEKALNIEGEAVGPELGHEALSVTTLCIALAVEMGCNPIILNGIDLAYINMHRYADGVLPSSKVFFDEVKQIKKASDRLIKKKDIYGKPVYTLVKWVMESECIASYAKHHPECAFINASPGGLGFSGIPNILFSDVMKTHLCESQDLNALLHTYCQNLKMSSCSREKIFQEIDQIYTSLLRLEVIADQMLIELQKIQQNTALSFPSGRSTLLEMDFQEEKAFECLLTALGPVIERLLNRAYYLSPLLSNEEKKSITLDRQVAKWTQYQQTIQSKKGVFAQLLN